MKQMDVIEAIKGRRSVRSFTSKEVPDEILNSILDCARYAPSAGNIQPWEFVIIRDQKTKRLLADAALRQSFIAQAPVVVVVCADQRRSSMGYGSRGFNLYCIQDTAAATQNILLTAHALGLGGCWVGAFNEDAVRDIIKVPHGIKPVAIIPIGWPLRRPSMPRRRSLRDVLHYGRF